MNTNHYSTTLTLLDVATALRDDFLELCAEREKLSVQLAAMSGPVWPGVRSDIRKKLTLLDGAIKYNIRVRRSAISPENDFPIDSMYSQ
jgi:hypothetical protein